MPIGPSTYRAARLAHAMHEVPVHLVILAKMDALAITDSDLGYRTSIVGGASVYPFVLSVLLAARARDLGVATTHEGVDGLLAMPELADIDIVFDATSAKAHEHNDAVLRPLGKRLIDLTPAAIGPYVIPAVNIDAHLDAENVNMVTCGGQATIPIVAAISRVVGVEYAEIVASISSKSAGPGTRANIDEFTETTSAAITEVGGAKRGKAIIILNPAEPPLMMRDTVFALISAADDSVHDEIHASVEKMVAEVAAYVPGYKLVQKVQITEIPADQPVETLLADDGERPTHQVSVFLQVTGAGHYLPAYAGNLDIMTSAALQVAERLAQLAEDKEHQARESNHRVKNSLQIVSAMLSLQERVASSAELKAGLTDAAMRIRTVASVACSDTEPSKLRSSLSWVSISSVISSPSGPYPARSCDVSECRPGRSSPTVFIQPNTCTIHLQIFRLII